MSACDRDLVTTAVWIRKSLLCWSPAFRITCRHWGKALVSIILLSKAGLLPPPPLPPLLLCSIFILFHSASSLLPRRLFPFEPSASSQSYRLRPLKCKVAIEEPIDLVYSLYTPISAESRQRELPDENTRGAWEENATAGLEGTLVAIFLAPDAMCFSLLLLMPRW